MRQKYIIYSIAVCVLLATVAVRFFYDSDDKHNEMTSVSDSVRYALTRSSGCNSSSGLSSSFEVVDVTTIRFYIENNADFDIQLKLQKQDGKTWQDSDVNGSSSMTVNANSHKLIESTGATYSEGTYRFSATGSRGGNYNYLVTMREFDN